MSAPNSTTTGAIGDITQWLTIISLIPYEMGAIADVVGPDAKKWAIIIGSCATILLRLIKRFQERAEAQPDKALKPKHHKARHLPDHRHHE